MAQPVDRERPASPSPPTRLGKGLRVLLLVLSGLEVVYLLAANVFLNTDLGARAVNPRPEKWNLAWQVGWSVIPGQIHLSGMVFDHHGRREDFRAEVRKISFDVGLTALADRRFAADDMMIEGLSIAIERHPEDAGWAAEERPPPNEPGWRIELSGVEITGLESLAFDDFEARGGRGRLTGDFELQLRGETAARRTILEWSGAVLRQSGEVLAEPLELHFDGGFSSLDPRQEKGFALLGHLSGHLEVAGTVSRLSILRRFFHRTKWIEALDGHGRLRAELDLEQGRLQPGSEVVADADGLRLDFLGYATEGRGRIHGSVAETAGEAGPVRMEVIFDDFSMRRKPAADPHLRGEGLRLVASASGPGLRDGLRDLDVVIDMPRAVVPNVAVYGAYLPANLGLNLTSGRGVISFHLQGSATEETVSGHLELSAEKLAGHFQDLDFEAGLRVRTRVSGGDLDDFRLEIEGTRLAIEDGVFRDRYNTSRGRTREQGWWMTVDVPRGTVHLRETPELEAEVELAMRDTRVIIAMFAELKTWLQRFEKILTVKDVTARGRIALKGQNLSLRELTIDGRKLRGRAEIELGEQQQRGILYLRYSGIPVGLERAGEEKDWKLVNVKQWFDRRVAESWDD